MNVPDRHAEQLFGTVSQHSAEAWVDHDEPETRHVSHGNSVVDGFEQIAHARFAFRKRIARYHHVNRKREPGREEHNQLPIGRRDSVNIRCSNVERAKTAPGHNEGNGKRTKMPAAMRALLTRFGVGQLRMSCR